MGKIQRETMNDGRGGERRKDLAMHCSTNHKKKIIQQQNKKAF
jgi:hypothetical protein